MKKAIAMKCTQEQYETIKPKLNELNKEIGGFERLPYLTNFIFGRENNIGNVFESCKGDYNREVFEKWNERIFLEACGIETEPEFVITKEQIISVCMDCDFDGRGKLKEWFPDAFKEDKRGEIGKWNKSYNGCLVFFINNSVGYGFDALGGWMKEQGGFNLNDDHFKWAVCEDSEVTEALKAEAGKRYKNKDAIKCLANDFLNQIDTVNFDSPKDCFVSRNEFWIPINAGNQNACVFKDGNWAEIIPTISKEDAEKELNKKII